MSSSESSPARGFRRFCRFAAGMHRDVLPNAGGELPGGKSSHLTDEDRGPVGLGPLAREKAGIPT